MRRSPLSRRSMVSSTADRYSLESSNSCRLLASSMRVCRSVCVIDISVLLTQICRRRSLATFRGSVLLQDHVDEEGPVGTERALDCAAKLFGCGRTLPAHTHRFPHGHEVDRRRAEVEAGCPLTVGSPWTAHTIDDDLEDAVATVVEHDEDHRCVRARRAPQRLRVVHE